MKKRIRVVKDKKEMNRLVDDFIIMGYKISDEEEQLVKVSDKRYGSLGSHILIFILFFWTYGIINIL